ncbi:MAG TPA: GC-type dockerin domain-anchored protein [Phycisphaerales bacterium]|nr:GC-type dockerin domain-anchored protein [Phycisphaerales bacterium]
MDAGPDNWAYTALDEDNLIGSDCYFRDGPPEEGCDGGWGHTTWRAMGDRYAPANVNYQVVAVGGPPPMPGDFDRDGAVTAADLAAFLQAWRAGGASADMDADGGVDTADFLGFLDAWTAR